MKTILFLKLKYNMVLVQKIGHKYDVILMCKRLKIDRRKKTKTKKVEKP